MSRSAATLLGVAALAMWGMLATLTSFASDVPPLQLTAMTLGIGGFVGVLSWPFRPQAISALRGAPMKAWLLGIFGLFGYHLAYFTALSLAPAVDASLIAYLWPLLIVVMASFLPGERLRLAQVLGAALGFLGAAVLVGGAGVSLSGTYATGYAAAFACALIWSSYSVLSRLFGEVSSDAVAGFCLVSAALAFMAHLAVEETRWPADAGGWMAITLLGIFPTGLAFYAWDIGVKRGNIQMLGVLSYGTPVVSTLLLALFGRAELTPSVLFAMVMVTLGAIIASRGARQDQGATA